LNQDIDQNERPLAAFKETKTNFDRLPRRRLYSNMDPVILSSNQPPNRFYKGGLQISNFRGEPSQGPRTPEDWIGSTTSVHGHSTLGQTRLPSGVLLRDEIERNAIQWLGEHHIKAFGADTKLLVKLLDAGQRLPIHAHPHAKWASAHIGASHGKSEAWYILSPGEVFLGLKRRVSIEELLDLVEKQDIETMLGLMHRVSVKQHQTVYVPPGLLHAIGEGIMVAEVQEPEDLSILLEWRDFEIDGREHGHLGLGFETALNAVETQPRTEKEIAGLVSDKRDFGSVLVPDANEYFKLERLHFDGEGTCRAGFGIMIVLGGNFELRSEHGKTIVMERGGTAVIPHAAGSLKLIGSGELLIARPPDTG
jgi:mannose-6-phosphate isomerase